jgi:hypothetical protein
MDNIIFTKCGGANKVVNRLSIFGEFRLAIIDIKKIIHILFFMLKKQSRIEPNHCIRFQLISLYRKSNSLVNNVKQSMIVIKQS